MQVHSGSYRGGVMGVDFRIFVIPEDGTGARERTSDNKLAAIQIRANAEGAAFLTGI